jgi:hypothetical protein
MRTRAVAMVVVALALAGCDPAVPNSAAGAGFGTATEYQRQQARLERTRTLQTPWTFGVGPVAQTGGAPAPAPAPAPVGAPMVAPGMASVTPAAPVSESAAIASEALAAIGAAPAAAPVVAPALPQAVPPVAATPDRSNIAAFALSTTHTPGTQVYRRNSLLRTAPANRACGRFASPGLAQEEFLRRGGPERDPLNIDPDGDGFVCGWNPAPFRIRN